MLLKGRRFRRVLVAALTVLGLASTVSTVGGASPPPAGCSRGSCEFDTLSWCAEWGPEPVFQYKAIE